jgi:hypothetical protein
MANGQLTATSKAASDARGSQTTRESGDLDPASRAQVLPGPGRKPELHYPQTKSAGETWEASDWPSVEKPLTVAFLFYRRDLLVGRRMTHS